MRVDELAPAPGATKPRKRVGRGIGGKGGKTAGRGTKGQHARNTVARGFEGGQMPLKQRVPKLKGFNNPFRVEYRPVNLDSSPRSAQSTVDARGARASAAWSARATSSRSSPAARSPRKVDVTRPRRVEGRRGGDHGRWR